MADTDRRSDADERRKAYEAANPLGGPARMFEAIASRIRAGEDYHEVLRDYDLQHISRATASNERAVALKCATICMNIGSMLKMEHQKYAKYANPEGARQLHAMHDTGAFRCAEAIRAYAASLSETPASETAKPTSEQQQRGVEAYQQWRANSDNRESSAYGGNLHDLARRMYESMR